MKLSKIKQRCFFFILSSYNLNHFSLPVGVFRKGTLKGYHPPMVSIKTKNLKFLRFICVGIT